MITHWLSVTATYQLIRHSDDDHPQKTVLMLIRGGLRGVISVALALSIESTEYRELLVFITCCVVVFSIVAQELTVKSLVKKLNLKSS